MPVTMRLSKAFYEQFGEQPTNELVELFNPMDSSLRSEMKDLFEHQFARQEAKLELRSATMETAFAKMETTFAKMEITFARMETSFAQFETKVERQISAQGKWLILSWVTIVAATIASFFKR